MEKIRKEIKKVLKSNENKNITYQILWNTTKVVLRRNFVTINVYIKNSDRFQINDLIMEPLLKKHK
jgi:hypothetical protein